MVNILRGSKIYTNWNFWYENLLSGNPGGRFLSSSSEQRDSTILEFDDRFNSVGYGSELCFSKKKILFYILYILNTIVY
jgi:hypothetical protein